MANEQHFKKESCYLFSRSCLQSWSPKVQTKRQMLPRWHFKKRMDLVEVFFFHISNWPKKDIKTVVSMGKSKSCIVEKVNVLIVCLGWMSVAVKMIVNFALKTCFKKSYNLLGFLKPCLIFNQIHSQIKNKLQTRWTKRELSLYA